MEIYFIISNYTSKNYTIKKNKKNKYINILQNKQDTNLLNKYTVKGDKKINHGPGKITINEDYNIFINTDNYNILMKKDLIYNVDTDFELEILNLSNQNINYYYISNN